MGSRRCSGFLVVDGALGAWYNIFTNQIGKDHEQEE
jgi:hypothetical protein